MKQHGLIVSIMQKSHPQNSEIAQAVVDGSVRPSTLPRRPWCQSHGNMLGRRRPSTTAHVRGQRRSNAMVSRSSFVANGRSRSNVGDCLQMMSSNVVKCRQMSSNVVLFRHSSRHAMSPSRRHDRRHVADMSPTRHAMSANEGLGRHFRLRHSLLSRRQKVIKWE
jgi:hypothetical protein